MTDGSIASADDDADDGDDDGNDTADDGGDGLDDNGDDGMVDTGAADTGDPSDDAGDESSGGAVEPPMPVGLCAEAPPDGAAHAPPPPAFSGGACPALVPGHNLITSQGNARDFILVAPSDLQGDEQLPLIFLWHWLGGSADSFLNTGEVQDAANRFRFIAAIPEDKGDLDLRWPYTVLDGQGRINEELTFFDDMLACVSEQFSVNNDCVSSAGVSAGGLWTSQLGWRRGDRLASFMPLSGGTGGNIQGWGGSSHKLPAFVLWGGPSDTCGINFQDTSVNLENSLSSQGHFMVECVHNCGHSAPPFDVPVGETLFAPLWQFAVDHPYWLSAGESPWTAGMPPGTPQWCGIGAGSATIRVGACNGSAC